MDLWVWVVLLASGLFLAVVVGAVWQQYVDSLPLRLSAVAARGELNGVPSATIRAMLGHGRVLRDPTARVMLLRPGRPPRPVRCLLPGAPVILGPWTITAIDAELSEDDAEVVFEVEGEEQGRRWEARAVMAASDLRDGRFGGIEVSDSGLRWDVYGWDKVLPPADAP